MDVCPTGEDSDDEDFDTAVKFGDLGVFDSRALLQAAFSTHINSAMYSQRGCVV